MTLWGACLDAHGFGQGSSPPLVHACSIQVINAFALRNMTCVVACQQQVVLARGVHTVADGAVLVLRFLLRLAWV